MQNNNYGVAKTNASAPVERKKFSQFMATTGNKLIDSVLLDKTRKNQFVANIISAVSSNPALQECDQASVVSAALQAEALHFPITNSLGYVYLVPFNKSEYNPTTRRREVVAKVAQFQIGYKGYIQLAIRSGQYKDINVVEVKEGELGEFDPLNGQKFNWINNYAERKAARTIGYVGQLELTNGFKKQLYITFEEMLDHANTYSQAFDKNTFIRLQNGEVITDENGKDISYKFSSFWYKNFDEMAKKTVLRQLLSKWGIMSVEMTEAYIKDQAEMKEDGTYDYVDSKSAAASVEKHQQEAMASVKVDVVDEAPEEEVNLFNTTI